jgi:hypothetical protein
VEGVVRGIFVTVTLLLSLLIVLAFPMVAYGLQAPTIWVDANGNIHSSPPEAQPGTYPGQATPANTATVYVPPASPRSLGTQAAPGLEPPDQYLLWQDPVEGAFSVSLPMGWRISGGTVRTTRIEAHYVVRAQAPDGGAELFMDDPGIRMREVPNQENEHVGAMIPTSSGTKLVLEPYRPGDQFAAEYVKQSLCPSATMMQGGPIAGQTQALNAQLVPAARAEGKTLRADAGEVSFKCGERAGYVYAITVQTSQPGGKGATWSVDRLAGYLTSPADSVSAAAAFHRMLGTFQMNQAWLGNYAKQCGDNAGNLVGEFNAITQTTIEREQAISAKNTAEPH